MVKVEEFDTFLDLVGELAEMNPESGVILVSKCCAVVDFIVVFIGPDKKLKAVTNELRRKYKLSFRKSQLLYIYNLMCDEGRINAAESPMLRSCISHLNFLARRSSSPHEGICFARSLQRVKAVCW